MIDVQSYLPGPNGMAQLCEDKIAELEAQLAGARTRTERSPINKHLHIVRGLLKFAKTRAGYRAP